VSSTWYIGFVE